MNCKVVNIKPTTDGDDAEGRCDLDGCVSVINMGKQTSLYDMVYVEVRLPSNAVESQYWDKLGYQIVIKQNTEMEIYCNSDSNI